MKDLSKSEVKALTAVGNAWRMVLRADKLCAEAGMDGDEVVQRLDQARRLLEQVAKMIES